MSNDPRHDYYDLTVRAIVRETADASSFEFDIPSELAELFRYRSGQFLTFRVPWKGMELQRSYSLASSPDCGEVHKVTVKKITDGRISHWFNDQLKPGDRISVQPPEGRFVLRESNAPVVAFAGGSGITPVISLLKTVLASTTRSFKLVYANQNREAIIFADELEALAAREPERFELVHHLDDELGFLDAAGVQTQLASSEAPDFYICGPSAFMDVVEEVLHAREIPRERIFIERFASPPDPDQVEPTPDGPPPETVPREIEFALGGATQSVPYQPGKTLLETAQDAGLAAPFACQEGYCATCMAKLVRGKVQMRQNDALSQRDLDDGFILTCQSVPTSAECAVSWDQV